MLNKSSVKAYAKVNFGLNVLPKRADGFHGIESIFQTVDLCDELIVEAVDLKSCISINCTDMVLPQINTLTTAYEAFCEIAGKEISGVHVELKKGIPSGGGLGGGSSDAAALVRGLEQIFDVQLSQKQLDYIAEKTGSDVFFFMHCDKNGTGCALVSGRGEVVKNIKTREKLWMIMIFPQVSSSTKEAYALVDEALANGTECKGPDFSEFEFIYNKSVQEWNFTNTFSPVIGAVKPEINRAINDIKKTNCSYAEMSGSGSTVYGVFTTKQQAELALKSLAATWCCKLVCTI